MKIAIAQTRYSKNIRGNIQRALEMVDEAGQNGAELLAFPEWFVGLNPSEPIPNALTDAFAETTRRNQLTLVMGSIRYQRDRKEKARQVALVLGPDGNLLGQQQKVNFYRKERPWFQAGDGVTPIETPLGHLVVLVGQDALATDLYVQVQAARPDWLIMQANEQVTEKDPPEQVIPLLRQTVEARSRELSCPVILVCPVGEFYGYSYHGGSIVGVGGTILDTASDQEGVKIVELSPVPQL